MVDSEETQQQNCVDLGKVILQFRKVFKLQSLVDCNPATRKRVFCVFLSKSSQQKPKLAHEKLRSHLGFGEYPGRAISPPQKTPSGC